MLQVYTVNSTGVTMASNDAISFTNIKVATGNTSLPISTTIQINKQGKYLIQFDGEISAAAANASVQMFNNGTAVNDAVATATSSALTDIQDLSFSTIVEVLPSCCAVDNTARLTFVTPTAGTLFKANVVVNRLCQ